MELSAYIHLNPVRSGLVNDPFQYRWSSYASYLKGGKEDLVDRDFLLAQFSGNKVISRREYERFVRSHISMGHRKEFYEVKDQRFLGSEEFVEDIHQQVLNGKPAYIYDLSIQEIVSVTSSVLSIPRDLFYSMTRYRKGTFGRAVVGYVGRKLCRHSVRGVAEHFLSKGIQIF